MEKTRTVVCDVEANGLDPTQVWCVVVKDIKTKEVFEYGPLSLLAFVEFAKEVKMWIGHHFLGYDLFVLNSLLGTKIKPTEVRDTHVMSRLARYDRYGGHGLKAWGPKVGIVKPDHDDWSKYSPAMLVRCRQDVLINEKVFHLLNQELEGFNEVSIWIEHQVAYLMQVQRRNGFTLDQKKAMALQVETQELADAIKKEIQADLPPKVVKLNKVGTPFKKNGARSVALDNAIHDLCLNGSTVVGPFQGFSYAPIDLSSPKQLIEALDPWWDPYIPTDGAMKNRLSYEQIKADKRWKLDDKNLATLSDDAPQSIKKIVNWLMLNNRTKLVQDQWLGNIQNDGKIHGDVFPLGAGTHRASHSKPNMANVPAVSHSDKGEPLMGILGRYGYECRDCWIPSMGYTLLGTDASGIQMRIFAHLVGDPTYINEVVNGDIHTKNQEYLGVDICKSRDNAKTYIYAFLLGVGDKKAAMILKCTPAQAKKARANMLRKNPGLKKLLDRCKVDASRGYIWRPDGARIYVDKPHLVLSRYLQGYEAVIMKRANIRWYYLAKAEKIDFKQVAWVHDEWQTEVKPDQAERLGELQVESIQWAGEYFKLKCPLDGEFKIGNSWAETH